MKHFFIQYGRFFLLAFVLGFLIPRLGGGSLQASTLGYEPYYKTYSGIHTLDEMIVAFHKSMNEATNKKLTQMFASPNPNVLYPTEDSACGSDNLSTYCLAYDLNNNLLGFEKALAERKDTLEELDDLVNAEEEEDTEEVDRTDTLSTAIAFANQQALVVEEQTQNAEDALDLTLAVYNQIQIVYPLHVELETFRTNLEHFRDGLAKVRDVIEGYPGKFNGASTAQCK